MFEFKVIREPLSYTGRELSPHWIYKKFRICGSASVSFVGPCEVSLEKMVDLEDVLAQEPISSSLMVHFIFEFFDAPGGEGLHLMVARQRLLMALMREVIQSEGDPSLALELLRRGDDLYFREKKLSVSIATCSLTSGLIHVGLNLKEEGAPLPVATLGALGVHRVEDFQKQVLSLFKSELLECEKASAKVRPVLT